MVTKVRMPKIDANVLEGAIGRWMKGVGERVEARQPLVEIITDKATFEFEAECNGILRSHVAAEKSVLPVGYVLALIADTENEPLPDVEAENAETMQRHLDAMASGVSAAAPEQKVSAPSASTERKSFPTGSVQATPAARRMARQRGVRLEQVKPASGTVIQVDDVLQYLSGAGGEKGGGNV